MTLPSEFQFTQGKLQDYVDCPRRFQLRHVLMQPWPALITDEPDQFDLHIQRGAELQGQRGREEKPPGLGRGNGVDLAVAEAVGQLADRLPKGFRRRQQRCDVAEQNPFDREVGDISNVILEINVGHDGLLGSEG